MTGNPKEFDIVIFGATGFTGRLIAEYMAKTHPGISWAIAGRNAEKLKEMARYIRSETDYNQPIAQIISDSSDLQSLRAMAKQAKVIISAVGPYQLYGTHLVEACAEGGVDYVDLSGEPAWMHDIIRTQQTAAERSGARIVLSCGFDSIPFDMGVYALQKFSLAQYGAPLSRIKGRVIEMNGTFSGGTAASFMASMARAAKEPEVLDWLKDPFLLVPDFTGPPQPSGHAPIYEPDLSSWSAPFIMAPINTKNIHRSNALLSHLYGDDFVYDEMLLTGDGEAGKSMAHAISKQSPLGDTLPKPGEGPSKQERDNGSYKVLFTGLTDNDQRLSCTVSGAQDPGYGSTSKIITEAAMCLAFDIPKNEIGGGIYTAAPAMGQTLIDRLTKYADLSFTLKSA